MKVSSLICCRICAWWDLTRTTFGSSPSGTLPKRSRFASGKHEKLEPKSGVLGAALSRKANDPKCWRDELYQSHSRTIPDVPPASRWPKAGGKKLMAKHGDLLRTLFGH